MIKKLRFLIPFAVFSLMLSGCGEASALKDNFTDEDLVINTPWEDFYLPASSVEFAEGEDSIVVNKGETHTYKYSIQPVGANANGLNWFSNNENIATVDKGVVTGIAAGETTIIASSPENAFDPVELNVQVEVPITSFELEEAVTGRLDWSDTYQFNVTYVPEDTTQRELSYEIIDASEADLVAVNGQGVITTANKNGTAKLKVTSPYLGADKAKVYDLTIQTIAVTGVTLSGNNVHEVEVNHSLQLSAAVAPETATEYVRRGVKFYSRNPDVATVDELTGLVTGVSAGTANIYAHCGIDSADYEVEVFEVHATSVAISTPDFTLSNATAADETKQLEYAITTDRAGHDQPSAATISFVSSDEHVASVSSSGLVTAVGPGNATIALRIAQEGRELVEDSVNVAVNIISKSLTIVGGTAHSLYNDETLTLSASLTPSVLTDDTINWTLSANDVVSLSATSGASVTLTPVTNEVTGTVNVTATNPGGASSTVSVEVKERPSEFSVGHHYIVGSNLYNTGESAHIDGKSSWTTSKYAYHFTNKINDNANIEEYKGTIKFEAGDQFKYFVGADYWVPAWEQQEGWDSKGWHIETGATSAFGTHDMKFVLENETTHLYEDVDANEHPLANIEVVNAGWYDLYAKVYKDNGTNWYALYIEKVPNLKVDVAEVTMGRDDTFQINAHDWIGSVTYEVTAGAEYVTVNQTGLVTGIATADGDATITLTDGRDQHAYVTIHVVEGQHASKTLYLNANGMFDTDGVIPYVHSWGGQNASPAVDVKMEKVAGQTLIYSASIPVDHTTLDFVRAPEEMATIDWDAIYNQTADQLIPTDGKDMFTQTGWSEEKDGHNRSYVDGSWSVFDSGTVYTVDGGGSGGGSTEQTPPYVMHSTDGTNWTYVALQETETQYEGSVSLVLNEEFVINLGYGDWRHFEDFDDQLATNTDEVVIGSASGEEHNFKAGAAGTYNIYAKKGTDDVYITFTSSGGGEPEPPAPEHLPPYIMYKAGGTSWNYVSLVTDSENVGQLKYEGLSLVAGAEFVICVSDSLTGWRHYENLNTTYSNAVSNLGEGSASGENPGDPHNFSVVTGGIFNFYVKEAADFEEGKSVIINVQSGGGEPQPGFLADTAYIVGSRDYHSGTSASGESWEDVEKAYQFVTEHPTEDTNVDTQYKASITFEVGDIWNINVGGTIQDCVEIAGAFGTKAQMSKNAQNKYVVAVAGTYDIYMKFYKNGTYGCYVGDIETGGGGGTTQFAVSFNANGGTGSIAPVNVDENAEYTLPGSTGLTAPTGKHFVGWKVNNEGDIKAENEKITITAAVVLWAQWEDDAPVVTAPYVMYKNPSDADWQYVALVENNEDEWKYLNLELDENAQFSIRVSVSDDSDWRHYENYNTGDGTTDKIIEGDATGENPGDPHNFKAKEGGFYNIFVKKSASADEGKNVYITKVGEMLSPYIMYKNPTDTDWQYVALVNHSDSEYKYEGLELEAGAEFVIRVHKNDWRHYEKMDSTYSSAYANFEAGTASGENPGDPHNFRVVTGGTFNFYVAKTNGDGTNVFINLASGGSPDPTPANYTVNVSGLANVYADGAVVYAWVWGGTYSDGKTGTWVAVSESSNNVLSITLDGTATGMKIVRFANGTAAPAWDGVTIWNQSGDINISSGIFTYNASM